MALNNKNVMKAIEILTEIYNHPAKELALKQWLDREIDDEGEFKFQSEYIGQSAFKNLSHPGSHGLILLDGKVGDGYESVCIQIKNITGQQINIFYKSLSQIGNSHFIETEADLTERYHSREPQPFQGITRIGWF